MTRTTVAVVASLSLAGLLGPPSATAQPPAKVYRIGYLAGADAPAPAAVHPLAEAFRQGLREHGYVEGKNLVIEFELVVNLGTARTLGLTIPPSVLVQVDHLIE